MIKNGNLDKNKNMIKYGNLDRSNNRKNMKQFHSMNSNLYDEFLEYSDILKIHFKVESTILKGDKLDIEFCDDQIMVPGYLSHKINILPEISNFWQLIEQNDKWQNTEGQTTQSGECDLAFEHENTYIEFFIWNYKQ